MDASKHGRLSRFKPPSVALQDAWFQTIPVLIVDDTSRNTCNPKNFSTAQTCSIDFSMCNVYCNIHVRFNFPVLMEFYDSEASIPTNLVKLNLWKQSGFCWTPTPNFTHFGIAARCAWMLAIQNRKRTFGFTSFANCPFHQRWGTQTLGEWPWPTPAASGNAPSKKGPNRFYTNKNSRVGGLDWDVHHVLGWQQYSPNLGQHSWAWHALQIFDMLNVDHQFPPAPAVRLSCALHQLAHNFLQSFLCPTSAEQQDKNPTAVPNKPASY